MATKMHPVLSNNIDNSEVLTAFNDIETRNIELFANYEDNNSVAQNPYEESANIREANAPIVDNNAIIEIAENNDTSVITESDNGILYAPEDIEDEFGKEISESDTGIVAQTEMPEEVDNNIIDELDIGNESALEIADASEGDSLIIPLRHNFAVSESTIEISTQAQQNQVAMASNNVKVQNLGIQEEAVSASIDMTPMPTTNEDYESPWQVAEVANTHITRNMNAPENNQESSDDNNEEENSQENDENDYHMVKNLLIPIPEDIMNEKNLTPQLSYSEENKKLSEKLQKEEAKAKANKIESNNVSPTTKMPSAPSTNSLTDSIASWFSGSKTKTPTNEKSSETKDASQNNTESEALEEQEDDGIGSAFNKLLGLGAKKKSNIIPSELKLSFQPNRAEISGQTLEWLHAFSVNAIKHEEVYVEIRIDGSGSYELQQKRLNLLYSILINNGVDYNKINIIFTDRGPNSFIIRNVRYANEETTAQKKVNTYNPWY